MLTTAGLVRAIESIQSGIADIGEQLNAADRRLGDGDTGLTVAHVVGAWHAVASTLPPDIGEALLALGRETGRATGSSLGAVAAMGLSAAGRSARGQQALAAKELAAAMRAAATVIAERSGAKAGDKTVLDALLGIEHGLSVASDSSANLLDIASAAAMQALGEYRGRECRVGRARMYGAQSMGRDDPGMLAVALLLDAARSGPPSPARDLPLPRE